MKINGNKNFIIIIFLAALYFNNSCYSQGKKQGVIVYKSNLIHIKDTAIVGVGLTIKFKPGKFLEEYNLDFTYGFDTETIITNGDATYCYGKVFHKSGKYYKNKSQIMRKNDSLYDVEYTHDTMMIGGFLCKKIMIKEKNGITLIAYVTDKIDARLFSFPFKKVEGFPLKFERQVGEYYRAIFTASFIDIESQVPDDAFVIMDEEDYEDIALPHPE